MDAAVLHALNGWVAGGSRPLWYLLARPEAPVVYGVVVLAWILYLRNWRALLVAVVAVGLTDSLCARVIKPAIARERPCHTVPVERIRDFPCGSGASMPSIHAANTAVLAAALASPPLAAASALVGTSRVVLGQHWPSDVLAGWAIGAGVGVVLRAGVKRGLGWS